MADSIGRFIVRTLAWLAPCFALWYAAGALFVWPAYALSRMVVALGFARQFADIERDATALTFVTRLRPDAAAGLPANAVVTFDVNGLIYTFGVPLLMALTIAARERRVVLRIVLSLLALVPFQAWGIVADALKTIAIELGPGIAGQAGFSSGQREAIAFAYQFGHLVLPAVAPAVTWVVAHRSFLERFTAPAS